MSTRALAAFIIMLGACEPAISIGTLAVAGDGGDGGDDAGDAGDASDANDDDASDGGDTCTPFVVTAFAAGDYHVCAISDAKLHCWGEGTSGQLGNGETWTRTLPTPLPTFDTIDMVAAMNLGTCARRTDSMLFCFGENFTGALANGPGGSSATPVETISGVVAFAGGSSNVLTRDATGLLTVWGDNSFGKLGLGAALEDMPIRTETAVAGSNYVAMTGGNLHTCVTDTDGHAYCAGTNTRFQLGIAGGSRNTYTLVTNALAFDSLEAGVDRTCGITDTGALYCWGANFPDVVVAGAGPNLTIPTRVGSASDYQRVSVGFDTICALRDGGRLFCWGDGERNALGLADEDDREVPTEVTPGTTYDEISVGRDFACARRASDDALVCFGENAVSQLGRGTDTSRAPAVVCAE